MVQGSSVSFDRAAEYYDQTRGFPAGVENPATALFMEAGNLTPHSCVLEIGVGTGRIALPLVSQVGLFLGLDISPAMMHRLRQKPGGEKIGLIQGNAVHLPLAASSLDAVIAVHVFHLIPNYPEVLQELARVLKPRGMLLHGWNDLVTDNILETIWREATHTAPASAGAIPYESRRTFLMDAGWRPTGEELQYPFLTERSPIIYVERIRQRQWSHTWRMSEEEIAKGLAAVEAYITANYSDPSVPVQVSASFNVQAYFAPNG